MRTKRITSGDFIIEDRDDIKSYRSENYNYAFNKTTGTFLRHGKTIKDNPIYSPSPELLDVEISNICRGIPRVVGYEALLDDKGLPIGLSHNKPLFSTTTSPCPFCYKSNTAIGHNMTLETFKQIIGKLPKTKDKDGNLIYHCVQIALGIGSLESNPDLFPIARYCRAIGIIPNVTINGWGLTDEYAEQLADTMGSVAVSVYDPKEVCYEAVKKLASSWGMKQINAHCMLSMETYDKCFEVIDDVKNDSRLKNLNAIVFLMLKKHGRGIGFNSVSYDQYKKLVDYALDKKVRIGFDSCSSNSFLRSIKERKDYDSIEKLVEPCESTLFSCYVDVKGNAYPCSFCPGEPGWEHGIPMSGTKDFVRDVWQGERFKEFRKTLLSNKGEKCRCCPMFNLEMA